MAYDVAAVRAAYPALADGFAYLDGAAGTQVPVPVLDALQGELTEAFAGRLLLWPKERADLIGAGGELDRVMQMPGWTNVWTMPIQNRVDIGPEAP